MTGAKCLTSNCAAPAALDGYCRDCWGELHGEPVYLARGFLHAAGHMLAMALEFGGFLIFAVVMAVAAWRIFELWEVMR